MLLIVLCFYAAIVATVVAFAVRVGFGLAGRAGFWRARRTWIVVMQVALGIAYMLFINFDASPGARIGWQITLICGAVGGFLSLVVVLPMFALFNRSVG